MTPGSSLRSDAPKKKSSPEEGTPSLDGNSFAPDPVEEITNLARTLANAGGGAVSLDLALDLVLNEAVEQARQQTRATGAAIALTRDGEMICRATTGNAPNLGTPVDTLSGLSAACLKTGAVQGCSDTEHDLRVDREACRNLDVRSMLLVPVLDDAAACGILEVFSSLPNNFGDEDVRTLQRLAQRIANAKEASEQSATRKLFPDEIRPLNDEQQNTFSETTKASSEGLAVPEVEAEYAGQQRAAKNKNDVLTSVLVVLVIAAAVLLGVVIGVRETINHRAKTRSQAAKTKIDSARQGVPAPTNMSAPVTSNNASSAAATEQSRVELPAGSLIVTQNGKVIYRTQSVNSSATTPRGQQNSRGDLLHRVEPRYPEAAKAQHIEGPVVLQAQVLSDGSVGSVLVIEGNPLLAEAAKEAVKQWKYQPYPLGGRTVERQERITVRFSLRPS